MPSYKVLLCIFLIIVSNVKVNIRLKVLFFIMSKVICGRKRIAINCSLFFERGALAMLFCKVFARCLSSFRVDNECELFNSSLLLCFHPV